MENQSEKELCFYEITERYIDYLKRFDDKIPNIKYETREKFVCGVLFTVNDNNYFAPVSSFNAPQKSNFLIKIGEYPVGSVRFSFMFPVPQSELKVKDFSVEDNKYVRLVNDELLYCNNHRVAITKKALDVYEFTNKGIPIYKQNCCNFKLLEEKCKEWEKLQMKTERKEIHFLPENTDCDRNVLDHQKAFTMLEMGVPICVEALVDKDGNIYHSQVELDNAIDVNDFDEAMGKTRDIGVKECLVEIKDVADYTSVRERTSLKCRLNPRFADEQTSNKFNNTLKVLTDPSCCFNKERCNSIQMELIEARPLTIEKLMDFSNRYIDKEALATLKSTCDKNTNDPTAFETISKEIDWSSYSTEQSNLKQRGGEIIWGSQLEGAELNAKDLEVALTIGKDVDGVDIPNDTPQEREQGIKKEIKKAQKKIKQDKEEKKNEPSKKMDVTKDK